MKLTAPRLIYVFIALALIYPLSQTWKARTEVAPVFALLVPNSEKNSLDTEVWLHAANEEGAPLRTYTYSEFLAPFANDHQEIRGILVPDSVARYAPATLIASLRNYVNQGGKLVIVGDAFSQNEEGRMLESLPLETYFHFPEVLNRKGDTLQYEYEALQVNDEWKHTLGLPPGSYAPSEIEAPEPDTRELGTYQKASQAYPHWKTAGLENFHGKVILKSHSGSLVAGITQMAKGQVLWINLPLSYLKRRTDGLMLHSFIRWISENWLGLPRLLAVPDGVGGIVMNIHVDSNAAIQGLELMKKLGLFHEGPFSIHVTAGPDTRTIGDGLGFNVPGNQQSRDWLQYWVKQGHEVGSHGGWIHDYFGFQVGDQSTPEFEKDLEENQNWIQKITKKPVTEFSAPIGNQPAWITEWIRKHGFNSYYFTGNSGMGPTQNFRDDRFTDEGLWSFPIAAFQQVASFEEASEKNISREEMEGWLKALTHFVAGSHEVRLFYFHPPGLQAYPRTFKSWMELNHQMKEAGDFRWYTMDELSRFLSQRAKMDWKVSASRQNPKLLLEFTLPPDEWRMTFKFNRNAAKNLKVLSGQAKIIEVENEYWVQAEGTERVRIEYEEVKHET